MQPVIFLILHISCRQQGVMLVCLFYYDDSDDCSWSMDPLFPSFLINKLCWLYALLMQHRSPGDLQTGLWNCSEENKNKNKNKSESESENKSEKEESQAIESLARQTIWS